MHSVLKIVVSALLALPGIVSALEDVKGASEVSACLWLDAKPAAPFAVDWTAGGSEVRCMSLIGNNARMTVDKEGLTCRSLGDVAVDDSWWCFFRSSVWEMSYTATNATLSGTALSRWSTGPFSSDITLQGQSPGTAVCGSRSLCDGTYLIWDNDTDAHVYIIFRPGKTEPSA
ncbi:hypothetical protein F4778DRAFT_802154 [Xylariomycetidae sp. FL2044]|nr:hypothetical protein F4778DRAFT_802154 [Xylariomycetidae sp. FL2044]